MGRTPITSPAFLRPAMPRRRSFFASAGAQWSPKPHRASRIRARPASLLLSYAIVPPQIDRSKPAHRQSDPTLYAGVVKERDGGIVLNGAQQLATGAALSDWLHLSCIHPLQPGDEAYTLSVAMPIAAPGLKIYSRRSYGAAATSAFDYPLSSRFDESRCSYVVLDDVFVPWEQVFVYRDIALCRDQWWRTPSHVYGNHQAQMRYVTKLRFMGGSRSAHEPYRPATSPTSAVVGLTGRSFARERRSTKPCCTRTRPRAPFKTARCWPSAIPPITRPPPCKPKFNGWNARNFSRHVGAPSSCFPPPTPIFRFRKTAADLLHPMRSGFNATTHRRVTLMRLIWDFLGSEFGSRHAQYEKFYGGHLLVAKQHLYRYFDFKRAGALVDAALSLPAIDG